MSLGLLDRGTPRVRNSLPRQAAVDPDVEPCILKESAWGHVAGTPCRLILSGSILLLLLAPAAAAQLSFVEIRERYFSASFEEALTMLNRLKDGGPPPPPDPPPLPHYPPLR